MRLFDEILTQKEFKNKPPVLIDIGASGSIHPIWKSIAKYSICIAFDADNREFSYIEKKDSEFKKLFVFNCIVSDVDNNVADFYLTKSPYCSSTLKPDHHSLNDWIFWDMFQINEKINLKSRALKSVLKELQINDIDWFKTDSQGIDLRLFKSIGDDLINNTIIAEFEPGIIDAYHGEDKLCDLLTFMDKRSFWVTDMKIKGPPRLSKSVMEEYKERTRDMSLNMAPCYSEIGYMNNFKKEKVLTNRKILLGWIFAILKNQHGFALELLLRGEYLIDKQIFIKMKTFTEQRVFEYKKNSLKQKVKRNILTILNKNFGKYFQ